LREILILTGDLLGLVKYYKMKRNKKRGISEIIATLLVIILIIIAIAIIWSIIKNKIENTKEKIETMSLLGLEETQISKATGDFENGGNISITIQRTSSSAKKSIIKSGEKIVETNPADIILVLDRSGSMRQSGWTLQSSIYPNITTNISVPRNGYSSTYSFSIPPGTQRLATSITWNRITGFNGSEGSEFAMNLRRPDGTWIANSGNRPDELGGKVDPPNSIGLSNEYFSGISTKPQYFYIENPQSGNWQVKVYGWNIRPSSNPPSSQNVSFNLYFGDSSQLNKSLTIISSDTVKSSSKIFVDTIKEGDRIAIVRFGSYGELIQGLSSNKSQIKNAIDNIGSEGGTAIHTGINVAKQHMISSSNPNSLKILTILTDGQNDLGPNPVISEAQQAKDQNFTIFTIGLTNFVDEDMLKTIATKPEYYYYSDFDKLDEIYAQLSEKIFYIQKTKTIGVSLIILLLSETSSCQKEIDASEVPDLNLYKTFNLDLNGCVTNITRIEVSAKIKKEIGPALDIIKIK